jgi:hypothetical protein
MRKRMMMALTFLIVATGPALAQDSDKSGLRSETESRLRDQGNNDILWNSIGLLGLLGLLGLRRQHSEDSYHPTSLD